MTCCRCGQAAKAPVLVRRIETISGPMRGNYACLPCGRWFGARADAPDWLKRDLLARESVR
ncbi:hypothetical protein [Streptomyces sp. Z26]|uniref:hypothetical protein n=1 Tax=Streptomyces TaxID=1883 RepID=UPI000EF14DBA|nr:hypothetical protein [Streptomyces sp. Z26]RLL67346.1 hypothetical protein D7M15_11275 [Streptomyces sp. Z26]